VCGTCEEYTVLSRPSPSAFGTAIGGVCVEGGWWYCYNMIF
jgi:hypothetical protein